MLKLVRVEGKSWGKILQQLHAQHRATHIAEADKLRVHYNNYTGKKSPLLQPYRQPKFTLPSHERKRLSSHQIKRKEAEFAAEHQRIREEREEAARWVREIEERELLKNSVDVKNEQEVRERLKCKSEERRAVRDHRLEIAEADAKEEAAFRSTTTEAMKKFSHFVDQAEETEKDMHTYLQLKIAYLKRKMENTAAIQEPAKKARK